MKRLPGTNISPEYWRIYSASCVRFRRGGSPLRRIRTLWRRYASPGCCLTASICAAPRSRGENSRKMGPSLGKKTVTVTIMTIIVTIMIVAVQRVASHRSLGAGNAALRWLVACGCPFASYLSEASFIHQNGWNGCGGHKFRTRSDSAAHAISRMLFINVKWIKS